MKTASAPRNLLAAPSSCSMNSSAFFRLSSVTTTASETATRWGSFMRGARSGSLDLDALFRVVLQRARMERDRRSGGLLVLELDVLGFLVDRDDVGLVVEDRLGDVVGGLVVHVLVGQ